MKKTWKKGKQKWQKMIGKTRTVEGTKFFPFFPVYKTIWINDRRFLLNFEKSFCDFGGEPALKSGKLGTANFINLVGVKWWWSDLKYLFLQLLFFRFSGSTKKFRIFLSYFSKPKRAHKERTCFLFFSFTEIGCEIGVRIHFSTVFTGKESLGEKNGTPYFHIGYHRPSQ